ncbi:hypothetical protein TRVL_03944 [Trypanosoma vivax]|nr:hypothetical protein TRVL_03944 [Trypanosoma vivax]
MERKELQVHGKPPPEGGVADVTLDPTSQMFDPKAYISRVFANAAHDDLQRELLSVSRERESALASLQQLMQGSIGTFIDSKEAFDKMYSTENARLMVDAFNHLEMELERATENGSGMLAPSMELLNKIKWSKTVQDALAKLMTVWGVPGIIYEHCGARVPRIKPTQPPVGSSDTQELEEQEELSREDLRSRRTRANEKATESNTDDEAHDDLVSASTESVYTATAGIANQKDDSHSSKGAEEDELMEEEHRKPLLAFGALEEPVIRMDEGEVYELFPGEELQNWHGVRLARHRTNIKGRDSCNFEAAVHNLRRAMLYLEENYDLELATAIEVERGDDAVAGGGGANAHACSSTLAQQQQRRHDEGIITLTYNFVMALLRAALYLNERLALKLQHVSADDTVLIEDLLSAMMDTSIATVRLRHFCWMAREKLPHQLEQGQDAMQGLRQQLQDGKNIDKNGEEDEEATPVKDNLGEDVLMNHDDQPGAGSSGSSSVCEDEHDTEGEQQRREKGEEKTVLFSGWHASVLLAGKNSDSSGLRAEHPVEYYIRITGNQHIRMMENIAQRFCIEADKWSHDFVPGGGENLCSVPNSGAADNGFYSNQPVNVMECLTSELKVGSSPWTNGSCSHTEFCTLLVDENLPSLSELGPFVHDVMGENVLKSVNADACKSDEQKDAEAILGAFRTPKESFAHITSFSIGGTDMGRVLECSVVQLRMLSVALLNRMEDNDVGVETGTQVNMTSAGVHEDTFANCLFMAYVDHLELSLASYWGGIGAEVNAGSFDFTPDPNSAFCRMVNGPAIMECREPSSTPTVKEGKCLQDGLPWLRYVPVISSDGPSLRQLSVNAVQRCVRSASDILKALFLASVNKTVLHCFVRTMADYRVGDLMPGNGVSSCGSEEGYGAQDEYVEMHAAVLVEVILTQWERAMIHVSEAVRRMKVVISEGCTSKTVQDEVQLLEVSELLEELEQLRSNLYRCYCHGVGMLAKAYVTLLPLLESPSTDDCGRGYDGHGAGPGKSDMKEVSRGSCSEWGGKSSGSTTSTVCARVSREFVSSVLTNKLLNLVSVVVDRTAPFLKRFDEVYDGSDLFGSRAERESEEVNHRRRNQRKSGEQQSDIVTARIADYNRKLVLKHVAEQEETLLALVANILLVFIDALHLKCQRVSLNTPADPEASERAITESLSDALCLSTATVPILTDELIVPCVLNVVVQLNSETRSSRGTMLPLQQRVSYFRKTYLAHVEEHSQLLVDALLGMFVAAPKQRITRVVLSEGFICPMMDWQRVSVLTAGAVRPYIANSITLIARAYEQIQWIQQPLLAATITQRLVAHLALTFVAATTVSGNSFEISLDCSANFLAYGLLLVEAEGRTVLGVADAVIHSLRENPRAGTVLPELTSAYGVLEDAVSALRERGNAVCSALAEKRKHDVSRANSLGAASGMLDGKDILLLPQREARCQSMVECALQRCRFIVEAILAHVNNGSSGAYASTFTSSGSSVAEIVAERLAKRKEGGIQGHSSPPQRDKDVRFALPKGGSPGGTAKEASVSSVPSSKSARRRSTRYTNKDNTSGPLQSSAEGRGNLQQAAAGQQLMSERLTVLWCATEHTGKRANDGDDNQSSILGTERMHEQNDISERKQDSHAGYLSERRRSIRPSRLLASRRKSEVGSVADMATFAAFATSNSKGPVRRFKRPMGR